MAQFTDISTLEITAVINNKVVRREVHPLPTGTKGKQFEEYIYQGPHNGKQTFVSDIIQRLKSKGFARWEVPGEATNLIYTWKVNTQVIKS